MGFRSALRYVSSVETSFSSMGITGLRLQYIVSKTITCVFHSFLQASSGWVIAANLSNTERYVMKACTILILIIIHIKNVTYFFSSFFPQLKNKLNSHHFLFYLDRPSPIAIHLWRSTFVAHELAKNLATLLATPRETRGNAQAPLPVVDTATLTSKSSAFIAIGEVATDHHLQTLAESRNVRCSQ